MATTVGREKVSWVGDAKADADSDVDVDTDSDTDSETVVEDDSEDSVEDWTKEGSLDANVADGEGRPLEDFLFVTSAGGFKSTLTGGGAVSTQAGGLCAIVTTGPFLLSKVRGVDVGKAADKGDDEEGAGAAGGSICVSLLQDALSSARLTPGPRNSVLNSDEADKV